MVCERAVVLWQARAGMGDEQSAPHAGNSIPQHYHFLPRSLRVWPLHSWHGVAGKYLFQACDRCMALRLNFLVHIFDATDCAVG